MPVVSTLYRGPRLHCWSIPSPTVSRKLQVLKPEGYDGTMRWLATQLGPGDHQADGFEGPAFDSAFDTAVDTETLYITAKDVLPSLLNLALRAGTLHSRCIA